MIRTVRVMLEPNNRQSTKLFQYAGAARYAYNWTLRKEQEKNKIGRSILALEALEKEFQQQIKMEHYQWMEKIPEEIIRESMKNAGNAYKNFLLECSNCPRFKSKKRSQPVFGQRNTKIQVTPTHIKIEGLSCSEKINRQKLNWVRLSKYNTIPINVGYSHLKIFHDGGKWYAEVGIIEPEENGDFYKIDKREEEKNETKMDKEEKRQTVCDAKEICREKTIAGRIEKLEKRERRLKRSLKRKYENNKEGEVYRKSNNMRKREKELLKINRRLKNLRENLV